MNRIALYHLETLVWIARLGTFIGAAQRLNTAQPTISARMRELEAHLGYDLFQRDGRRMVLTVRGRQLVQDCEPLWAALERALAADGMAGARGMVRIGTGEIAAASCLPAFAAAIERDLPGVTLDITVALTAQLLQDLLGAAHDIVFLAGPVASPGMKTASIGQVDLCWLATPATATRIAQGIIAPIWSLPRHSPLHQILLETLPRDRARQPTVHTCNNVRMLIDIVEAGQGMALLPEAMARDSMAAERLVDVWPRPPRGIDFQAAIRAEERDPVVLDLFSRAQTLQLNRAPAPA